MSIQPQYSLLHKYSRQGPKSLLFAMKSTLKHKCTSNGWLLRSLINSEMHVRAQMSPLTLMAWKPASAL